MSRILASCIVILIWLTGCTPQPILPVTTPAPSYAAASVKVPEKAAIRTLADIQTTKKLVVGTAITSPFEFRDPHTNELVGFDVEIAEYIAGKLGVEIEWAEMPFGTLIPNLAQGRVDMTIAAMYITPERQTQVAFAEPYITTGLVILAPPELASQIQSQEDLAGYRVGVKIGATGARLAEELAAQGIDLEVEEYKETMASILDLEVGRVDLVFNDYLNTLAYLKDSGSQLQIISLPDGQPLFLSHADLGIAVHPQNTDLLAEINAILNDMHNDGTFDLVIARWLK